MMNHADFMLYPLTLYSSIEYYIIIGILFIRNLSLLTEEVSHVFNVWHLMLTSQSAWEE